GRGVAGLKTTAGDTPILMKHAFTHTDILFFTTLGKVYRLRGYQIPDSGRTGKGMPAQNFLNLDKDERVVAIVTCDDYNEDNYLFFVSRLGVVKRTSLAEFASIHANGKIAIGLREGDDLFDVKRTDGQSEISLASSNGKVCTFSENDVRPMGRTAAGVKGMDLSDGSEIVGATGSFEGDKILVLSSRGLGKISYAKDTDITLEDGSTRHYDGYRFSKRGAKGVTTMNLTTKTGKLTAVRAINGDEDLLVMTSNGVVIRTPIAEIKIASRNTQGVKIINLDEHAKVVTVAILPHVDPSEIEEIEGEAVEEEAAPEEAPVNPNEVE
ncbi:MAG: DNA gyrase subunit A, partial [Bacilli bacterium]|nr:DNA gyrase subunit A [Bacilli bacterium]